jgi:hypothetical protein
MRGLESSVSDPDPRIRIQFNRKKLRNFMFVSAGCFLLRAEGFSAAFMEI